MSLARSLSLARLRTKILTHMVQTKEQKKKIVEELKELLSEQKAVVLVGISGLKVKEMAELRKKLKASNSKIKVLKKTLAKLAFAEKKIDFEKDKFKKELAFVFGLEDEVSPAKTVFQFSKDNENLKILGGFIGGQFKEAEEIIALAQIPSKEELFARLVGSISAPVSNLVYALNYNIKGLLQVLTQAKT